MNTSLLASILVFSLTLTQALLLPAPLPAMEPEDTVLATLNDHEIRQSDILPQTQGPMFRIENQIYNIQKDAVKTIINNYLLATAANEQNISVQDLLKQEVLAKMIRVTDNQVTEYYNQNSSRFAGKTLEEIKVQLKESLQTQMQQVREQSYYEELRRESDIQYQLERPVAQVPLEGAPSLGPDDAPVTLVEFSDYQ